jgi:hypothetical protein
VAKLFDEVLADIVEKMECHGTTGLEGVDTDPCQVIAGIEDEAGEDDTFAEGSCDVC